MAIASGAITPLAWNLTASGASGQKRGSVASSGRRYRAVSWWIEWEDLVWPNQALMDKIQKRADRCAASCVNCCIVFGAHFRWDFMPLWDRVHDLIRFVGDELHQREIVLFDHHSSVLTHRPRNREEALNIWRRNRHHVPFYPAEDVAATMQFNGSRLNDWRMLDVETGQPIYLPTYNAEQFCMNHPGFQEAYVKYVGKLRKDTGIDGLMSDDGIFYSGWRACACEHCRKRFKKEYGHKLPPVGDRQFWGNRRSQAFRDWIDMRFRTSGDFLANIKKSLPEDFPLLTCCSSSDGHALPASGMSYQDFIRSCNHVLLEMCGSTPSTTGTWDDRIPSQLLHLGIAREHRAPCFGLGYGYFPDTAFFVWALNKFLGSDSWFSTLKGRLNASQAQLESLADDSELVEEGYRWEKAHPQLFSGEVDTNIAVFFSRATRDFYGECHEDYVGDFHVSCLKLMRAGISYDVVTAIPRFGKTRRIVLSSAICLSQEDRHHLAEFLKAGGTVIATGPIGNLDQRANPVSKTWLQDFGLLTHLQEPERSGGFPPYQNLKSPTQIAECQVSQASQQQVESGWFVVPVGKGRLYWRPDRVGRPKIASSIVGLLASNADNSPVVKGLPSTWQMRQYRDGNRLLIHALPAKVQTVLHAELRNQFAAQNIIEKIKFAPLTEELGVESPTPLSGVLLHSPDLTSARAAKKNEKGRWVVNPSDISRYFVLECIA